MADPVPHTTQEQIARIERLQGATKAYVWVLRRQLLPGADKDFILEQFGTFAAELNRVVGVQDDG